MIPWYWLPIVFSVGVAVGVVVALRTFRDILRVRW